MNSNNSECKVGYYANGNKWFENYHREDGPSRIQYYFDNTKSNEEWYQNGKKHRINYAASICYYENGNKFYESWCQNDKFHRLDGAAFIEYDENGNIKSENYYINNIYFTKDKYYKIVYLVKKFIKKIKSKQKSKLSSYLNRTQIPKVGKDVFGIIVNFIY